jgi:hypothetical protein
MAQVTRWLAVAVRIRSLRPVPLLTAIRSA